MGSSGESLTNALDEALTESDDIEAAVASFSEGGARDGEEYFSGILAEVVEVDVKFREVEALDEIDASQEDIVRVLDTTIVMIADARKALDLYTGENWSKRAEFHELSLEWFASVETLINDYVYDLSEAMAKPDEEWTDEEIDLYNEYLVAYDDYLDVDSRWVDFQYVYAEANGFTISGTIDEEAMVEEQMSEDVH